jgi:hypothetical protein
MSQATRRIGCPQTRLTALLPGASFWPLFFILSPALNPPPQHHHNRNQRQLRPWCHLPALRHMEVPRAKRRERV